MKKQEMECLNQSDTKTVVLDILNKVRDRMASDDYFLSVISLSAIAYWYKTEGMQEKVMTVIEKTIKDEVTVKSLIVFSRKYWPEIEAVARSVSVDTLKEIVIFFDPTEASRMNGTFVRSRGVSKLAIKLLDINANDVVLNLCSGGDDFLIEVAKQSSIKQQLIGVDINTKMIILSNIRAAVADIPIHNVQGNMLSQDFSRFQANKVFANFPFMLRGWNEVIKANKKLYPYFVNAKRTVSSDWVFSTAAMLNQMKPGKTVVRMANRGLWNEADQEIRKTFINSGLVEAVISLPERLLANTSIPFTMLVFSQGNTSVRMVDASGFYTAGRRQNTIEDKDIQDILAAYRSESDKSRSVTIKELEEQDYILNPLRYISIPDQAEKMEKSVQLGEIISGSISRGAVVKSSELDQLISPQPTGFRYLMLKDIKYGRLSKELPYLDGENEKYDKYCVKNGNLIISKISPFKIAMVEIDEVDKVLANGNLYFLDIDKSKANPVYVMLYLQSDGGMTQLNSWAKGAVMKSISLKDLQKIRIPDIPLEQQKKIAEAYQDLNNELLVISRQEMIIRNKIEHLIEEVL